MVPKGSILGTSLGIKTSFGKYFKRNTQQNAINHQDAAGKFDAK